MRNARTASAAIISGEGTFIVESEPVDQRLVLRKTEEIGARVSRLGARCDRSHFDEAKAQAPQRVDVARVLVKPRCEPYAVGETQAEEIDAGTGTTGNKPLQSVPCEQVPQPQRRECYRLRAVRIETEQPRPDQAV